MKDSEILREVKKYLPTVSHDHRYICWAIRALDLGTIEQQGELIKWINFASRAPMFTLGDLKLWVRYYHPEFKRTDENMLKLRMKWLDWMIAECEKDEAKMKSEFISHLKKEWK